MAFLKKWLIQTPSEQKHGQGQNVFQKIRYFVAYYRRDVL